MKRFTGILGFLIGLMITPFSMTNSQLGGGVSPWFNFFEGLWMKQETDGSVTMVNTSAHPDQLNSANTTSVHTGITLDNVSAMVQHFLGGAHTAALEALQILSTDAEIVAKAGPLLQIVASAIPGGAAAAANINTAINVATAVADIAPLPEVASEVEVAPEVAKEKPSITTSELAG